MYPPKNNNNTVQPVLSGPHIKGTPCIKRTNSLVSFKRFPHILSKTKLYLVDASIKRTPVNQ